MAGVLGTLYSSAVDKIDVLAVKAVRDPVLNGEPFKKKKKKHTGVLYPSRTRCSADRPTDPPQNTCQILPGNQAEVGRASVFPEASAVWKPEVKSSTEERSGARRPASCLAAARGAGGGGMSHRFGEGRGTSVGVSWPSIMHGSPPGQD